MSRACLADIAFSLGKDAAEFSRLMYSDACGRMPPRAAAKSVAQWNALQRSCGGERDGFKGRSPGHRLPPRASWRRLPAAYNALDEVYAATRCFSIETTDNVRRAPAPDGTLSPRFARLVRESWWLLFVAAFVYLGLILASYTSTDPGWSFSGTGAPLGNRGGVVGAWLADLLLYLFGLSAWWWVIGGVVLVDRRLPPHRAARRGIRSSAVARARSASRWCCSRSAALEVDPAVEAQRVAAARRPAARSATRSGSARRARSASTAPRCCCSRCCWSGSRCFSASRGCA